MSLMVLERNLHTPKKHTTQTAIHPYLSRLYLHERAASVQPSPVLALDPGGRTGPCLSLTLRSALAVVDHSEDCGSLAGVPTNSTHPFWGYESLRRYSNKERQNQLKQ